MGRCPWHGEVCDCGEGYPFPLENFKGLMPQRCEERTPLYMVAAYPTQSRRKKEYEEWWRAGQPRFEPDDEPEHLHEWQKDEM